MKGLLWSLSVCCLTGLIVREAQAEAYGTFESMGVVVHAPQRVNPKQIAEVRARLRRETGWRPVQNLVQVGKLPLYATSLFFLQPDTEYEVEVEFLDKAGDVLSRSVERGRTRAEPILPHTVKALCVSPEGSDTNPGTAEAPLRTLAKTFSLAAPGTTVWLAEGTYYEGELNLPRDGTADAPIVVRAVEGAEVVLDGADPELISADWQSADRGLYRHPFESMTWNVTLKDRRSGAVTRLYPMRTLEELTTRRSAGMTFPQLGITGAYHWDGKSLTILPPAGNMSQYDVYVARMTDGIVLDRRQHVWLDGLAFRHFGRGNYGKAVFVRDSSDVVVQRCRVEYSNSGVWVKGDTNRLTVQECSFLDDCNRWHFSYMKGPKGWNYHGHVETGGVYVDGTYTGRGLVVRGNQVEGLFDGLNIAPHSRVGATTSETDCYDNRILSVADDVLETDGYSRNVRIFRNFADGSLSGISLAQALDGPTYVVGNVIVNCGQARAALREKYEGYPFKTNGGPGADIGSGHVFFYHNTTTTTDRGSRAILIKHARWRQFTFRNNIWCGEAWGFMSWQDPLSPIDMDYDDIFVSRGQFMKVGRTVYPTLTEVQKRTSYLKHGLSADPRFVDLDNGDYHLQPGSPCIDRGTVIPGINDGRFRGQAPDLGAYEAN